MFLTLYYLASTYIQSRRLNLLKNTYISLIKKNSTVVIYKEKILSDNEYNGTSLKLCLRGITSNYCINKHDAHLVDLWCDKQGKRGCSVIPLQTVNITNWIKFPNSSIYFPIELQVNPKLNLSDSKISVLLEANIIEYSIPESSTICQLENYGVPKAWTTNEYFVMILETDIEHLTKFSNFFILNDLFLNSVMEIIRVETVTVLGTPYDLLNYDQIPILLFSFRETSSKDLSKERNEPSCKNFHAQMLRLVSKSARDLENSSQSSKDLEYPPVTIVKSCEKNVESLANTLENVDVSISSEELFSHDQNTSMSLLPQTRSSVYSLSASSQYSADTVLVASPLNIPMSISVEDFSKNSKLSLLTSRTSSLSCSSKKLSTPMHHQADKTGKPPNIIIFSESPSSAENIRISLNSVLRAYRYTIYVLSLNDILYSPWIDQAILVVICGNVPLSLKPLLLKYLLNSEGRLFCVCSDLLGLFLPNFKTAEVRPNEIISFSYSKWSHVNLLHHIFCYQPSPKTSKFSMDESPSGNPSRDDTPLTVELTDINSKLHTLQVNILAAEETWQTPTLLVATNVENNGKALFSQVHLEVDPHSDSEVTFESKIRLSILADLLSTHLGLECDLSRHPCTYTCGYFLGRHERKLEFLKTISSHLKHGNALAMKNTTLIFCGKGATAPEASDKFLPIMLYDCPRNFSTVEYFENLKTEHIGRLVIYSELMTSSMDILNGPKLEHGMVAICRQQTSGIGRGGNKWISPDGCATFSLQLHISLKSNLGQRLSMLQHIVSLSIVSAICNESEGYKMLDIGLKWPNDIYAGGMVKIGGLIISSLVYDDVAVCNIGCALNLNNSLPTTCLNNMIIELNEVNGLKLPKLSAEKYFAIVFTQLEKLINIAKNGDFDIIFKMYYEYWLHDCAEIKICKMDGKIQKATIIGLDDFGFLQVKDEQGEILVVHPDGNSFDMLTGLIAPK